LDEAAKPTADHEQQLVEAPAHSDDDPPELAFERRPDPDADRLPVPLRGKAGASIIASDP
jgi:hypothetical protein